MHSTHWEAGPRSLLKMFLPQVLLTIANPCTKLRCCILICSLVICGRGIRSISPIYNFVLMVINQLLILSKPGLLGERGKFAEVACC